MPVGSTIDDVFDAILILAGKIIAIVACIWVAGAGIAISVVSTNTTAPSNSTAWTPINITGYPYTPKSRNFTGHFDDSARFGVDQVSGFYGPGSWAAWLLTMASCYADRLLVPDKPQGSNHSHVLSLDLNLFGRVCLSSYSIDRSFIQYGPLFW
jgi:hypothetical protein